MALRVRALFFARVNLARSALRMDGITSSTIRIVVSSRKVLQGISGVTAGYEDTEYDAQLRAALLTTQTEGERQLRTLQQMQSVQPSAQAGSAFSGGLIGRLTQTLETEGVSSIQAQRSMGEISRFFERDARRYGG